MTNPTTATHWTTLASSPPIADPKALLNDGDASDLRGEGEHDVAWDVATTTHHDLIRLAFRTEAGTVDFEVLLTADAAWRLRRRLIDAVIHVRRRGETGIDSDGGGA
jgi:hypothetical protein